MNLEDYNPCLHKVMDWLPEEQVKGVSIQKCALCGFEAWHYEDAKG